jgi:hypothetical protein
MLHSSFRVYFEAPRPFFHRVLCASSLLAAAACVSACSSESSDGASGGASNGSGGNGGNGGASQIPYAPCSDDTRVGLLTLKLVPPEGASTGYSEFSGVVSDKVMPSDVWVETKKEGDCRLITGPKLTCAPTCKVGEVCLGNNQCTSAPAGQDVGTITLTGLLSPLTATPTSGKQYYKPITGAFPPATPGAEVTLNASGGTYPAFSLRAGAIDPLEVPPGQITLDTTKPLTFSWTAPSVAGSSRVVLSLDLAHHGNVAAKLVCDVADTGSATVPVSMLTALAAEGIAGFPSVAITRLSVTSTTLAPGCVQFAAASSVNRELVLPGLTSCGCPMDTCEPCTAAQVCQADYTCK